MTLATRLKAFRLTHNYLGVFFAPTILFFSITGGLQMFGLHETSRGSSYTPPALLVHLSQLHKKGTLYLPPSKTAKTAAPKPDSAKPNIPKATEAPTSMPAPPNPLPMKIFFAAAALALVLSTCTGLFMAWVYARRKILVAGVFAAGIICPLVALLL
ncbi:PepSY domain-containing protein [Silvibacterium acidisoli]|uniref:PepSY domain-containing protein n=1 Tax=Acidobacteriaceae bacterium ZG23-2 TaxID=2883246 RepID=UPI00406C5A01